METCIITPNDFIAGRAPRRGTGTHNLKAEWIPGKGIKVTGPNGEEIHVTYGSTMDLRTCYAHVSTLGFIGGWRYPHMKQPFLSLVNSINKGVLYYSMNDLPNGRKKK